MISNEQVQSFKDKYNLLAGHCDFDSVKKSLENYEKSKWIDFDETAFPEELLRKELQVLVKLNLGEKGFEKYVTTAYYTGDCWRLTNSGERLDGNVTLHLASSGEYVNGCVTHYQPLASMDHK